MHQRTVGQVLDQLRRLTFSEILEWILKTIGYIYALSIGVLLFASNNIGPILGLQIQQVVATFIFLIAGFLIHFDRRLSVIANQSGMATRQVTMRDAFDEAFKRYSRVRQLRLYGSTTQLMVQWFEACCRADELLHVTECKLMAHEFSEEDFPKQAAHYNTIRQDSFAKWKEFKNQRTIDNISVVTNRVMPQVFLVMLDENVAIVGTYVKRKDGPTGLFDLRPMLIYGVNESEKIIIKTYKEWFDAWFEISESAAL